MNAITIIVIFSIILIIIIAIILGCVFGIKQNSDIGTTKPEKGFYIELSFPDPKTPHAYVKIEPTETVETLKKKIYTKYGSYYNDQYQVLFLPNSEIMSDKTRTLASYNMTNGTVILVRISNFLSGKVKKLCSDSSTNNCYCMAPSRFAYGQLPYCIENTEIYDDNEPGSINLPMTSSQECQKNCTPENVIKKDYWIQKPIEFPKNSVSTLIGFYDNNQTPLYLQAYTCPFPENSGMLVLTKDKKMASIFNVEFLDKVGTIKLFYKSEQNDWYQLFTRRNNVTTIFKNFKLQKSKWSLDEGTLIGCFIDITPYYGQPNSYCPLFKLVNNNNEYISEIPNNTTTKSEINVPLTDKVDKMFLNDPFDKDLYGIIYENNGRYIDATWTRQDSHYAFFTTMDSNPTYTFNEWQNTMTSSNSLVKSFTGSISFQNKYLGIDNNYPVYYELTAILKNRPFFSPYTFKFNVNNERTNTAINLYNVSRTIRGINGNVDKYGDIFYLSLEGAGASKPLVQKSEFPDEYWITFQYFIPESYQINGKNTVLQILYQNSATVAAIATNIENLSQARSPVVIYNPDNLEDRGNIDFNKDFCIRALFVNTNSEIINKNEFVKIGTFQENTYNLPFEFNNEFSRYRVQKLPY